MAQRREWNLPITLGSGLEQRNLCLLPEWVRWGGIGNPGYGGLFFVASTDGKGWENVDRNHQPTRQLMNVGMSFSPSAVVWRNMIYVFHEGYQQNGQLWYSYHDGQNWHPDQQVPGVVIGTPASGRRSRLEGSN